MRAGNRRHLITFERLVPSGAADEYGSPEGSWVAQSPSVWASIEAPSAKTLRNAGESVVAGAYTALDLVEVGTDPFPGVEPVGWRFRWRERVYDIKAARLSNNEDSLTILASVGASDGL